MTAFSNRKPTKSKSRHKEQKPSRGWTSCVAFCFWSCSWWSRTCRGVRASRTSLLVFSQVSLLAGQCWLVQQVLVCIGLKFILNFFLNFAFNYSYEVSIDCTINEWIDGWKNIMEWKKKRKEKKYNARNLIKMIFKKEKLKEKNTLLTIQQVH